MISRSLNSKFRLQCKLKTFLFTVRYQFSYFVCSIMRLWMDIPVSKFLKQVQVKRCRKTIQASFRSTTKATYTLLWASRRRPKRCLQHLCIVFLHLFTCIWRLKEGLWSLASFDSRTSYYNNSAVIKQYETCEPDSKYTVSLSKDGHTLVSFINFICANHSPSNHLILNVPFHYIWPRNIAKCNICYGNVCSSVCLFHLTRRENVEMCFAP